jgi:hypothetical protein
MKTDNHIGGRYFAKLIKADGQLHHVLSILTVNMAVISTNIFRLPVLVI